MLQNNIEEIGENLVVDRYVYNGDYDCNLSYWDNINNLIDEEICIKSECFTPEKNNCYPLCVGKNNPECSKCNLNSDFKPEE